MRMVYGVFSRSRGENAITHAENVAGCRSIARRTGTRIHAEKADPTKRPIRVDYGLKTKHVNGFFGQANGKRYSPFRWCRDQAKHPPSTSSPRPMSGWTICSTAWTRSKNESAQNETVMSRIHGWSTRDGSVIWTATIDGGSHNSSKPNPMRRKFKIV